MPVNFPVNCQQLIYLFSLLDVLFKVRKYISVLFHTHLYTERHQKRAVVLVIYVWVFSVDLNLSGNNLTSPRFYFFCLVVIKILFTFQGDFGEVVMLSQT